MGKNQRKKGNSRACCGSLGKKVASVCIMAMGVDPRDIYNTWFSLDVEGDSLPILSRLLFWKIEWWCHVY